MTQVVRKTALCMHQRYRGMTVRLYTRRRADTFAHSSVLIAHSCFYGIAG